MKCKITAMARVNPTEDRDKVINAISNIFKFDELEIGEGYVSVTGENESLLDLRESLKVRKIRDTAQRIFLNGTDEYFTLFISAKIEKRFKIHRCNDVIIFCRSVFFFY